MTGNLSRIASECPLCGDWQLFTGEFVRRHSTLYAVVRCRQCATESNAWRRAFEPVLDAYRAVRPTLLDPEGYAEAFAILREGSAADVGALIRNLSDAYAHREVPFLQCEPIALPCEQDVIGMWARIVVEHPGFRPLPTAAERISEGLALAMRYDNAAAAGAATHRLEALDDDALGWVIGQLPGRIGGAYAAHRLRRFFDGLIERDERWRERLQTQRRQWAIPELRDAARRSIENAGEMRVYRYTSVHDRQATLPQQRELLALLRDLAESQAGLGTEEGLAEAARLLDDAWTLARHLVDVFGQTADHLQALTDVLYAAAQIASRRGDTDGLATATRAGLRATASARTHSPHADPSLDRTEQHFQQWRQRMSWKQRDPDG